MSDASPFTRLEQRLAARGLCSIRCIGIGVHGSPGIISDLGETGEIAFDASFGNPGNGSPGTIAEAPPDPTTESANVGAAGATQGSTPDSTPGSTPGATPGQPGDPANQGPGRLLTTQVMPADPTTSEATPPSDDGIPGAIESFFSGVGGAILSGLNSLFGFSDAGIFSSSQTPFNPVYKTSVGTLVVINLVAGGWTEFAPDGSVVSSGGPTDLPPLAAPGGTTVAGYDAPDEPAPVMPAILREEPVTSATPPALASFEPDAGPLVSDASIDATVAPAQPDLALARKLSGLYPDAPAPYAAAGGTVVVSLPNGGWIQFDPNQDYQQVASGGPQDARPPGQDIYGYLGPDNQDDVYEDAPKQRLLKRLGQLDTPVASDGPGNRQLERLDREGETSSTAATPPGNLLGESLGTDARLAQQIQGTLAFGKAGQDSNPISWATDPNIPLLNLGIPQSLVDQLPKVPPQGFLQQALQGSASAPTALGAEAGVPDDLYAEATSDGSSQGLVDPDRAPLLAGGIPGGLQTGGPTGTPVNPVVVEKALELASRTAPDVLEGLAAGAPAAEGVAPLAAPAGGAILGPVGLGVAAVVASGTFLYTLLKYGISDDDAPVNVPDEAVAGLASHYHEIESSIEPVGEPADFPAFPTADDGKPAALPTDQPDRPPAADPSDVPRGTIVGETPIGGVPIVAGSSREDEFTTEDYIVDPDAEVSDEAARIAEHAFQKHVVENDEFPELSNATDLAILIEDIITGVIPGVEGKKYPGRTDGSMIYIDPSDGTILIVNKSDPDGGTVYRPGTIGDAWKNYNNPPIRTKPWY